MTSAWKDAKPADEAWKSEPGLTRADYAREQDAAAGGHENRLVRAAEGRRTAASVALRLQPNSRRVYAYLRWSSGGRTRERYIGEVHAATRAENLELAWRLVRERGWTYGADSAAEKSWASSPVVRVAMQGNKSRDTKPERALRSAVHALGLRYRVAVRPLPSVRRSADLVFSRAKVAVFLDGCFWHGCPEHHRPATKNGEFWASKIGANRQRDEDTNQRLREAGWIVIRVWEHEDPVAAAKRVFGAVKER